MVLCCDGFYQRCLLHRAAAAFQLVGAVVQHPPRTAGRSLLARLGRYRDAGTLRRQLEARWKLPREERKGRALQAKLFAEHGSSVLLPEGMPLLHCEAINGPESVSFVRDLKPDLILVNGTQLLRDPLLSLRPEIRHGIINLHTGLSPYSRGANCNLYMILEGHLELVGVTIHHIDPGIDSGDIIRSAQIPLEADDNFETIDVKSFHLGIELLIQAGIALLQGSAPRVAQWESGRLFLQRTGYHYEPWQRLQASRQLAAGQLQHYLANRHQLDAAVQLVGAGSSGPPGSGSGTGSGSGNSNGSADGEAP